MLDPFVLPQTDARLVRCENRVYKLRLEYRDMRAQMSTSTSESGRLPCTEAVMNREMERVVATVIQTAGEYRELRLQTDHFLLHCQRRPWPVSRRLSFRIGDVQCTAHPEMFHIYVMPKPPALPQSPPKRTRHDRPDNEDEDTETSDEERHIQTRSQTRDQTHSQIQAGQRRKRRKLRQPHTPAHSSGSGQKRRKVSGGRNSRGTSRASSTESPISHRSLAGLQSLKSTGKSVAFPGQPNAAGDGWAVHDTVTMDTHLPASGTHDHSPMQKVNAMPVQKCKAVPRPVTIPNECRRKQQATRPKRGSCDCVVL